MADNPQALLAVSLGLILFALIVIALFIVFVHTMPGKIARKRGNPQAEAIEILSLLGLLIFPLWMAALVWSYMRPFTMPVTLVGNPTKGEAVPEPNPEPEPRSQPDATEEEA
jgi:amino acid transporter